MSSTDSPCFEELKPYFDRDIIDEFRKYNRPVPYMMHLINIVCNHTECAHHIFYDKIVFRSKDGNRHVQRQFKETDYSRECCNCMCLIERPATYREITEMYSIAESSIDMLQQRALKRMRTKFHTGEVRRGKTRSYIKQVRGDSNLTRRADKYQ